MALTLTLTFTSASASGGTGETSHPIWTQSPAHKCTHTHAYIHSLSGQVAQTPVFWGGLRGIRTGAKKSLRPDVAQRSPLLRHPHWLPLFMRRLNEAAGAAEMNQSPAWAWEGCRTGRPAWSLGGDQQGEACGGGVAMPSGGNGAAVLLSCPPPPAAPHPFLP